MGEKSETAKREEEILAFWEREKIFEKSLAKPSPQGEFVFYDGPPFATGLPHSGSLLSSVSKDLIPRYKTMRGYFVRRRWGWDTHGLPIENLVEKKLGLKNKKEILALGVRKFNETARSMVLEFVQDWKRYIERVGRWVDFDHSYKTMDASYTESVWWALKRIYDKGHLYEGKKVLMYCPHCETPLAKAEIAMDNTYKEVTEEAVTVKFKVKPRQKIGNEVVTDDKTYILAWTTTPWTLPGNVALAVKFDTPYVIFKRFTGRWDEGGKAIYDKVILAKDIFEQISSDPALPTSKPFHLLFEPIPEGNEGVTDYSNLITTITGEKLVGVAYEPLYEIQKVKNYDGQKHVVVPADFVTTEEGTGIVHTAVMYGEDDFNLGTKEKLPMVQLLNPNGTYNDEAPEFLRGQYIKKAEPLIKEDLEQRGLLFSKAPNTHSYPHCYRCGTALIFNAVSSWFINIQAVKAKMLAENEEISWFPAHLKKGRFKHNLETAPDWTISRNRFWASPLPIWKDAKGNVTVIGSLEELKAHTKKSGNTYFVMRHGEAENNVQKIVSADENAPYGLTEHGREQVKARAVELVKTGITRIICSPFKRTRETAEIVGTTLGVSVTPDQRIGEFNFGDFSEKPYSDFLAYEAEHVRSYTDSIRGGESYQDAKNRFGAFLYELEKEYTGERILIVSHGIALEVLTAVVCGADKIESKSIIDTLEPKLTELRELQFVPLPHNDDYELDYHLPYIDEVKLISKEGEPLTRISEVVDCWVESGSMPFAEYHYPFEHKDIFHQRSPGDFISEYIGQTRAWFYYLHAMNVELFGRATFKNVITTGTILAADGEKISKSKGNYTDPYELFERYGADAFRYYLMSSVVMQAEDLTFRDEDVKEAHARVVNMLRNVGAFYELFKDESTSEASTESPRILDRWILARLNETIRNMAKMFDAYDVMHATREIREFVDDLSTWYVRRSRDRVKDDDENEKKYALSTLRYVLLQFSKAIAPVTPFIAEELFSMVRAQSDVESVHLSEWPQVKERRSLFGGNKEALLIKNMAQVRMLASEALQLRQKAQIKVRQPLSKLTIGATDDFSERIACIEEYKQLIKDEVNVKTVYLTKESPEMKLNTEITDELHKEGDKREMASAIAQARKTEGFSMKDLVHTNIHPAGKYSVKLSTGTVHFDLIRDAA